MCQMKKLFPFVCAVASAAWALPPVRPELPPVEYLDTETVTNVPFTAWQDHLRYFTFKLAFNATPSNNVEMAFGMDGSTGTTGILPVGNGSIGTTGVPPVEIERKNSFSPTGKMPVVPVGLLLPTGKMPVVPVRQIPRRAPLRHAAEFGATLTHFHISTLSHFHNSTFSHFQRPHDPPPGGVGIAVCLAAASQNPTSAPLSACGVRLGQRASCPLRCEWKSGMVEKWKG